MSLIQSRDDIVSLISANFNFLTTNGFQVVDVEFGPPETMFWAVTFEEKCCIRISWYWHDGISIMIAKYGTPTAEYRKWYALETLVYFLAGKEIVQQFYEKMQTAKTNYFHVETHSNLLSTYFDKIIELVADDKFGKREPEIKQAYQALLELQMQKK